MEQRRQLYAAYSPVFWRPAQGVTGFHARFLRRQIASPANVALRTDHGFIIGQRRAGEGFVDDFAVDAAGSWEIDGADLLDATWQRLAPDADLAVVEAEATALGAVLLVLPAAPGIRPAGLDRPGWSVASDWYVGQPAPIA